MFMKKKGGSYSQKIEDGVIKKTYQYNGSKKKRKETKKRKKIKAGANHSDIQKISKDRAQQLINTEIPEQNQDFNILLNDVELQELEDIIRGIEETDPGVFHEINAQMGNASKKSKKRKKTRKKLNRKKIDINNSNQPRIIQ